MPFVDRSSASLRTAAMLASQAANPLQQFNVTEGARQQQRLTSTIAGISKYIQQRKLQHEAEKKGDREQKRAMWGKLGGAAAGSFLGPMGPAIGSAIGGDVATGNYAGAGGTGLAMAGAGGLRGLLGGGGGAGGPLANIFSGVKGAFSDPSTMSYLGGGGGFPALQGAYQSRPPQTDPQLNEIIRALMQMLSEEGGLEQIMEFFGGGGLSP